MTINVGTSARYSYELADVRTTRRVIGSNTHFYFLVDGHVIKKLIMCNATKEIIEQYSMLS